MARRISCVGFVTVSLRRSTGGKTAFDEMVSASASERTCSFVVLIATLLKSLRILHLKKARRDPSASSGRDPPRAIQLRRIGRFVSRIESRFLCQPLKPNRPPHPTASDRSPARIRHSVRKMRCPRGAASLKRIVLPAFRPKRGHCERGLEAGGSRFVRCTGL